MTYLLIITKGLFSIVTLFLPSKMMGRKQVSELNLFDYIIGISIGSIAAEMTLNKDIGFFEGVLAIFVYAFIAYCITKLTNKSIIARRLVSGSPCILIENGNILYEALKKSKIDVNDLLQQARSSGYFNLNQIEYAIMEPNGKISFLLRSKYQPVTRTDMKLKTSYEGLCCDAVIDGKIMKENLKNIGKDEEWLKTRLKNNHYDNIEDLILVLIDSKEQLYIYEKNNRLKENKMFE